MRRPTALALGTALTVGTAAVVLQVELYDGILSVLLPEDTQYAGGYDETRFRQLGLPAPAADVVRELGPPLQRLSRPGGGEAWIYSRSPRDTHYRVRVVHVDIDGGVATDKLHEFYVD